MPFDSRDLIMFNEPSPFYYPFSGPSSPSLSAVRFTSAVVDDEGGRGSETFCFFRARPCDEKPHPKVKISLRLFDSRQAHAARLNGRSHVVATFIHVLRKYKELTLRCNLFEIPKAMLNYEIFEPRVFYNLYGRFSTPLFKL